MLKTLIKSAKSYGASDLHIEAGLPPVMRIDGELTTRGDPVDAEMLLSISRGLIGDAGWHLFTERGSYDLSANIANARCRINIFKTFRGISLAIRVFSSFQPTLKRLNLHPDLMDILCHSHGLVLVSGPTGSGKSSTMAALIQELNLKKSKHIITVESPIEYLFKMQRAFIRQREVGRDTPSFYQGLIDAMREDPDVLMVGEMREPDVMRQTLNAAETGHLVFTTVHSGTATEAIQRVVGAFPAEIQDGVRAQLADTLLAVICQRLIFMPQLNLRVPECEILFSNFTTRSVIREGKYFKLNDIIQTGARERMWSFSRYRTWIKNRTDWYTGQEEDQDLPVEGGGAAIKAAPPLNPKRKTSALPVKRPKRTLPPMRPARKKVSSSHIKQPAEDSDAYYEIGDTGSESTEDILKQLTHLKKEK